MADEADAATTEGVAQNSLWPAHHGGGGGAQGDYT